MLDLICQRYPGTKPSDYFDDLSDYEAFQLNGAMAYRGMMIDRDYNNEMLVVLLEGMRGIMKAQGAKPGKIKPPVKNFVPTEQQEISVNDWLVELGGTGVVLE